MRKYLDARYRDRASPAHVWCGVSVEDASRLVRVRHMRASRAVVRFLSLEPLLGPLPDLDLTAIHWVIVGSESSPGARPMCASWVTALRDRCARDAVPFFFKQWGGRAPKANGRLCECAPHAAPEARARPGRAVGRHGIALRSATWASTKATSSHRINPVRADPRRVT